MSRIVVIANDRDYVLRHRLPVVERLVADGVEVTVLAGGATATPPEARGWRFVPVPLNRLSINPLTDGILFVRLARLLWHLRPDAVHLITLKPAVFGGLAAVLLGAFRRGPRRILITIPGLGRLMSPGGQGAGWLSAALRGGIGRVMRFLSARPAVHVTFETEHDRRVWIDSGFIRADNSTVINGAGVDPKTFFPRRQRPEGPLRVLFASRLLRSKGLDAFVDLARRFAASNEVEFVVAGWGDPADPDNVDPRELAAEPSITFLGEVKDMPTLLRKADLVCLPTRYGEGVPRILIETAASGVASLATDIEGCRAIIEDRVTGTLVNSAGGEAMASELVAAIERYLASPHLLARQGKAAHERFLALGFSESVVVDRFVALLLLDPVPAKT